MTTRYSFYMDIFSLTYFYILGTNLESFLTRNVP